METDLHQLCNLLTFYKESLAAVVNKIDEKVNHAISTYKETHTKESSTNKYKISMQMIEVLQNHIKTLHTYENLSETLTSNLVQLELDTQPEKEDSCQNPFISTPFIPLVKIEQNCASPQVERFCEKENTRHDGSIKIERNCVSLETNVSCTKADTETVQIHGTHQIKRGEVVQNEQKIQFDTFVQELTDRSDDTSDGTDGSSDTLVLEVVTVDETKVIQASSPETEFSIGENFEEEELRETHPPLPIDKLQNDWCRETVKLLENKKLNIALRWTESNGLTNDERDQEKSEHFGTDTVVTKAIQATPSCENFEAEELSETQDLSSVEEDSEPQKRVTFNLDKPQNDWCRETVKLFENKKLKVGLRWTESNGQTNDERDQEKCGHFGTDAVINLLKSEFLTCVLVIEEDDLSVGQHCVFTCIESPSEFYVCTNRALLKGFEEHLNEIMNTHWHTVLNKFKSKFEARNKLGDFCFVFFPSRRKWYRVEVLNWMDENPETILVQLIDYGEKLFCSYTTLKGIPDLVYSMFPKLAIRCHMAGIYSPYSSRGGWPQESVDFFEELSEMDQETEFTVIFVHREGDSYAVDLRKAADADGDSLGEVLVKNGQAFQERVPEDDFLYAIDENDLEESDTNEDGYGSDDENTVEVVPSNKMILPLHGEVIEILVTGYMSDTCHFYAQILRNFTNGKYYNYQFRHLVDNINTVGNVQSYEGFAFFPGVGELALVKDDTTWCRGRCVRCNSVEDVEVFLVDFGNTVNTALRSLRRMEEEFLVLPFQAVECILSNCKEKDNIPSKISMGFFNNVMKMKSFTARVVESTHDVMKLEMWDTQNMDMGQVLKTFGLGEDL